MNLKPYADIKTYLHGCAETGDLVCTKAKKFPHSHAYTIGVAILIAGGAAVAAGFGFVAVPIIAASAALVLIAYSIYQIYQHQQIKKQCAPFEPIFKNILSEDYQSAWEQLKQLLEDSDLKAKAGNYAGTACRDFVELFPPDLAEIANLEIIKLDELNFHTNLLFYTGLLSACSQYKKDDPELLKTLVSDIKDYGSLLRGGGYGANAITQFIQSNSAVKG